MPVASSNLYIINSCQLLANSNHIGDTDPPPDVGNLPGHVSPFLFPLPPTHLILLDNPGICHHFDVVIDSGA